jgi:glucoamylase
MGLIVTNGHDFFSEEKRHTDSKISCLGEGVPAFRLVNTCKQGRYRIEKELLADPSRPVLLQRTRFSALMGSREDYHLYVLLAPHLGDHGYGNTAWQDDYKGVLMLFAKRADNALALACSFPWLKRAVGFVGVSDGWQDLSAHKQMTWAYTRAENGNVALTGELDLGASNGDFVLATGFGSSPEEAGDQVLASLRAGFDTARTDYLEQWAAWQKALLPRKDDRRDGKQNFYRVSTAVIRTHEATKFPGGIIASLSIPWGFTKSDEDLGGYHLVWPRDLVEAAGGLLAAGAHEDVRRVLGYLEATQREDGHWPQSMWLDGSPYWDGIQLDETALPILLVDLGRREKVLTDADVAKFWPMVRKAAGFLVRNGPVTQQDRWEEDPGYSPFTLAAEISSLLAAADLSELNKEPSLAAYLRQTADALNDSIERWIYVQNTAWTKQFGVEGYYVRIAPPEIAEGPSPAQGYVPIKNRPPGQSRDRADHIISPDALALVRFGLRAATDQRIINTVKIIDALLKVATPSGPAWHRYNGDGYGEHADGAPFDGTGIGRAWPLLTGERAHYELAAGRLTEAEHLLHTLESFANEGGLIPEQIWDTTDTPNRELYLGRPSGSAMPLVWAHAEYVKLVRSLCDRRVFDTPPQTLQRYVVEKTGSAHALWRFNHKLRAINLGKILRVETLAPALVHWSANDWRTVHDTNTRDSGLGMHWADLPTDALRDGTRLVFTFNWVGVNRWEGQDFSLVIGLPHH